MHGTNTKQTWRTYKMAIDIDKFLDEVKKEEKPEEKKSKQAPISLDFQKEVEGRISEIKTKAETSDLELLKKIYTEIKKFDEDMPHKFLGIEKESSKALKEIGSKYSSDFLNRIKTSANITRSHIKSNLDFFDAKIQSENFITLDRKLEESFKILSSFPKELSKEKDQLLSQIRKREILLHNNMLSFKQNKLKNITEKMSQLSIAINKAISKGDKTTTENMLSNAKIFLNQIPIFFTSDLITWKIQILSDIAKAENAITIFNEKEFEQKKKNLYELFEKFHQFYINKKLDQALLIYDEIILNFNKMPEVYLDQKIEIYKQINSLYTMINNLLIKNTVSTFFEAYNSSKVIEEARSYIEHAKTTKTPQMQNLIAIKEKLELLPPKYTIEKEGIKNEIEMLTKGRFISTKTEKEEKPEISIPLRPIELPQPTPSKPHPSKDINKNILREINLYFNRMQKSTNPREIQILYDKILFYVKLTPFDEQTKNSIIERVNKLKKYKGQ